MAFKDKDILKPSMLTHSRRHCFYDRIIPIAIAAFIFGGTDIGNIIIYIMGAFMIFAQFIVSYVFSGMTVYLIYGYLSEGDGRMDHAWEIVKRDFF